MDPTKLLLLPKYQFHKVMDQLKQHRPLKLCRIQLFTLISIELIQPNSHMNTLRKMRKKQLNTRRHNDVLWNCKRNIRCQVHRLFKKSPTIQNCSLICKVDNMNSQAEQFCAPNLVLIAWKSESWKLSPFVRRNFYKLYGFSRIQLQVPFWCISIEMSYVQCLSSSRL